MRNKNIIMAFIVIIAMQQSANAASCTCSNLASGVTCHTDCVSDAAGCRLYTCDDFTRCAPSNPCDGSDSGCSDTCYTSKGGVTTNYGTGCVSYTMCSTTITRCDSCNDGYTATESYLTMCDGSTSKKYWCRPAMMRFCDENKYDDGNECVDCPDGGITRGFGANVITDCYQPAGTAFTDAAGSGIYKEDCYYSF